jgi:hypothetical protein
MDRKVTVATTAFVLLQGLSAFFGLHPVIASSFYPTLLQASASLPD